jgi:hypothetical protein
MDDRVRLCHGGRGAAAAGRRRDFRRGVSQCGSVSVGAASSCFALELFLAVSSTEPNNWSVLLVLCFLLVGCKTKGTRLYAMLLLDSSHLSPYSPYTATKLNVWTDF